MARSHEIDQKTRRADERHNNYTMMTRLLTSIRTTFPIIAMILLTAALPVAATETTARPDRGMGGEGGYQTSNIDSVSLQSGSVNVQVPLASLPPVAGGKLGYTLTAFYDSKLWNVVRREETTNTEAGCPGSYTTEEVQPSDQGGWRIGGRYRLFFRDPHDDFDYQMPMSAECSGAEFYYMAGGFFKPVLQMPDGSEHELRIFGNWDKYEGSRDYLANYYKQSGGFRYAPAFPGPVRFYTIDGSFITVTLEATPNPGSGYNYTIYMKDGTRVENSPVGQRTIDPNGNSILRGTRSLGGGVTEEFVRDERTGREIKWSRSTYNGHNATKVDYQTVGGGWASTYVVWGTTSVRGKMTSQTSWNPAFEIGCTVDVAVQNVDFPVIRSIVFPQTEAGVESRKFVFEYNSDTSVQTSTATPQWACGQGPFGNYTRQASLGWGELSRVTTPTGAVLKYNYVNDGAHDFLARNFMDADVIARNVITTKVVTHDGIDDTWTYSVGLNGSGGTVVSSGSVVNPDGSVVSETYNPTDIVRTGNDGSAGKVLRSVQSGRILVEKKWTALGGLTPSIGRIGTTAVNSVVDTEFTSLLSSNGQTRMKMTAKKFVYDFNGELLQTIEYDWFSPSSMPGINSTLTDVPPGTQVKRVTNTSYYNQAMAETSPTAYHRRVLGGLMNTAILGMPQETRVGDGSVDKSTSRFSYDGQSYGAAPTRGNLTQTSSWDDSSSSWVSALIGYDSFGNVTSKTDANGNVEQIYYEDSTFAMPTRVVNALGHTTLATYDYSTGRQLTATDINGNTSSTSYFNHLLGAVDPFGRPGTSFGPYVTIDGQQRRQTVKTFYEDAARRTRTEADLYAENDGLLKSRTTADQLGRTILSEKNENGAAEYTVFTETIQRNLATGNTVTLASNPRRVGQTAPTDGWTRVTTDTLGRTIETATFAGAAQPPLTGGTGLTGFTGRVLTAYNAELTTVTDQAGKRRRSVVDALGRLIRVDEPDANGNLDANGQPVQPTHYEYDVAGNLTKVIQGVQTRTFAYNSLSRLTQATNPESGTVSYTYDPNGNVRTKRDARNIKTIFEYDILNRATKRCYRQLASGAPLGNLTCAASGETAEPNTPEVAYTYDILSNGSTFGAKGALVKVTNGFSTTETLAFDNLGRVLSSRQQTDGQTFNPTLYKYNLAGAVVEQTYPSGRVVRNQFDNGGDLAAVQSRKNGASGFWHYAQNFGYNAAGAAESMQLGNFRWESTQFNSRLQPTRIALGTTKNATNLLKLDYDYGDWTSGGVIDPTKNNGNVLTQTITVPTEDRNGQTFAGFTAVQKYYYDPLNRISQANETIGNTQQWQQTFVYDRYGNRNLNEAQTTTLPKNCGTAPSLTVCQDVRNTMNPGINPADNRLSTGTGYQYDAVGNTTRDAVSRLFVYNGDNMQTEVRTAAGVVIGRYFYDGDGKRVKKVSFPGSVQEEIIVFVYDSDGHSIAEYASNPVVTLQAKVNYVTNDHLSSPRINTDSDGQVTARHDFMPFGEEIQRLSNGADTLRQKFTGYERDNETDLDYAQARMYASKLGRFNAVDPYNIIIVSKAEPNRRKARAMLTNYLMATSKWNRYAYGLNNPLLYVDPNGEDVLVAFTGGAFGGGKVVTDSSDTTVKLVNAAESEAKSREIEFSGAVFAPGARVDGAVNNAYDFIKQNYKEGEALIIYGYSNGGDAAVELAEKLKSENIKVDLLITVDASDGPLAGSTVNSVIPDNVAFNQNIYQTLMSGPLNSSGSHSSFPGSRGQANTAADPNKTFVRNNNVSGPGTNHANIDENNLDSNIESVKNFMSPKKQ